MIRSKKFLRGSAVVAGVLALTLSACGTTDSGKKANAGSCKYDLAYVGPKSGPAANLGIFILGGAKTAVAEYNAKADKADCVTLKEYDTQGDKDQAKNLVQDIIKNNAVIGVVGPAFSGESDSTGAAFNEAGLVTVSASATNPDLTKHGWKTFHRVLGTDAAQAPADAKLLTNLGAKKVFVVDDAQDYSKGLADEVKTALGGKVVGSAEGKKGDTDWSGIVGKVKASGADSVFYGGYYQEAGLLMKGLRDGGFTGQFVSGDGSLDQGFITAAGDAAAEGAYLTCPCAPSPADFTASYKKTNGSDPGTYSAEAYDAANILLQGIAAGNTDRAKLLNWVNSYDADGITKHIKFDNGEVSEVVVYAYKVEGGKILPGTPIK